jgi:hypothetical protein
MLKQLSVFIENKPGRLCQVTGYLAEAGINIHAMSLADTMNYGILRLIVNDAAKAEDALKERGLTVKTSNVVAVAISHKPGGLHEILVTLEQSGVAIEYMYAFTSKADDYDAMVVMCLVNQDKMLDRVTNSGIKLIGDEIIGKL